MRVVYNTGDLFTASTDAIGHGVNCKGLMGAGIAVRFRSLYPDMYEEYRKLCMEDLLRPGQIYPYKAHDRTVINIASQEYPGPDAQLSWVASGIANAAAHCVARGLKSLAIPRIGCGIGGLDWMDVAMTLEDVASVFPSVRFEVWTL